MVPFDDVIPVGLFAGDDVEHGFAHSSQYRKRSLLNRVQRVPYLRFAFVDVYMSGRCCRGWPVKRPIVQASCGGWWAGRLLLQLPQHGLWVLLCHPLGGGLQQGAWHLQGLAVDEVRRRRFKAAGVAVAPPQQYPRQGIHPLLAVAIPHLEELGFEARLQVFMGPLPRSQRLRMV